MATDFFERQSKARKNTVWLVAMFVLAAVAIVVTIFFVALAVNSFTQDYRPEFFEEVEQDPYTIPLLAAAGALLLIVGGSLFRVSELRSGGGASVAQQLGGKRLMPGTSDVAEQRLLNVVEEMALASGVPVPPVYLMEEPGINAFAAGYSASDAVVGVTRGAVEQLTRDELQGVIAHEFSHILNGDMRMGIRLMGILYGILLLSLIGSMILRGLAYSGGSHRRRSSSNGNGGSGIILIAAIGAVLLVLGYLGSFLGRLIKAAVSREREYLADASAVQFTRNPQGIGGALKRIGSAVSGSQIKAAAANEASHLFFAQGVWEGLSGLTATHPPLPKRILAIEPGWDGKFPEPITGGIASVLSPAAAGFAGGDAAVEMQMDEEEFNRQEIERAVDFVGDPQQVHRQYVAELLGELPVELTSAAHEPHGAQALVFCLLLDSEKEIRTKQVEALREKSNPGVLQEASRLYRRVAGIDDRARLPLVDLTLPALQLMSAGQFRQFCECVHALIAADGSLGLFEWTLGRIVERHLKPHFAKQRRVITQYYGLQRLGPECSMLLSTLAHLGHDETLAERAFRSAEPRLKKIPLQYLDRNQCSLEQLRDALDKLSLATAQLRGQLLDACVDVVTSDGEVTIAEAELLRGIGDLLECPVPPVLAGQDVEASSLFAGRAR